MTEQSFAGVRVVGGLLPADLLSRLVAARDVPGLASGDYHLGSGESVREAANRSWSYLTAVWSSYQAALALLPDTDRATTLTRDRWLQQLLGQLGYGRVPGTPAGGIIADAKAFPISHCWQHVPMHLLGWRTELDKKTPGVAGAAEAAPQSLVQECLNRAEEHLWALLSNGRTLRVLRDSTSLVGSAYVEFDLETIFSGELFSDFLLLYTLCHESRFDKIDVDAGPESCWMERWRTDAIESGSRALDQLREGVRKAIETLGSGFLHHRANSALRDKLAAGVMSREDYRQAMLRLVYRLLFLFVAEDRNALLDPASTAEARSRFNNYFSTNRLRIIARRRRGAGYGDLWQGLNLVIDGLGSEQGRPELGLPGIGGLFEQGPLDFPGLYELSNESLLETIRSLALITEKKSRKKRVVDYRNLGAEELGSIYESLLEYVPQHDPVARSFTLVQLSGNERKTSGSYYTPSALIETLLDSALEPLLADAMKAEDPRTALLKVTICDPACGSGHFLVAAARRIAKRVATVDTGDPEPPPEMVRTALREVVATCIYGVDLNPLAADLAKVSLWLEAMQPGRPLAFLDAQIKVGNALIGTTPKLLAEGIPDDAFKPIEGDDKATARMLLKRSKTESLSQGDLFAEAGIDTGNQLLARQVREVLTGPSLSLADAHEQARRQRALEESPDLRRARTVADAWCAAFVQPKIVDAAAYITQGTLLALAQDPTAVTADAHDLVADLTARYRFFHWHLEFPHIFLVPDAPTSSTNERSGWNGGFACVLGNPPWDTLSPDEKEFFSAYDPAVRFMKKEHQRQVVDSILASTDMMLEWGRYRRDLFAITHFIKNSGRYSLFSPGHLEKGDFNVYRMFVESALSLVSPEGTVTQVTPSGIYNGANSAAIRKELLDRCQLLLVLGMINRKHGWFDSVDSTQRFAAYVARRRGTTKEFGVAFQISSPNELRERVTSPYMMSVETLKAQSPETLSIGETLGGSDAVLADHMYRQWSAFGDTANGPPLRRFQAEIHMGSDRDLFDDHGVGMPIYEGRMVAQYDHRAKAHISGRGRSAVWEDLPFESNSKKIAPQWRVREENAPAKLGDRIHSYRIGFCDVTSPRNERSFVAALMPPGVMCGHKVPTITFPANIQWAYLPWLACANSLCIDYLARKKIALSMTQNVVDSLPIPHLTLDDSRLNLLATLALRLTCTGPEMTDYWNAMSAFGWSEPVQRGVVPSDALTDDTSRAEARAEIDAYVALNLFHLTREQVEHLLSTFPTLARNEFGKYGEYRTKRLVLDKFDSLSGNTS